MEMTRIKMTSDTLNVPLNVFGSMTCQMMSFGTGSTILERRLFHSQI